MTEPAEVAYNDVPVSELSYEQARDALVEVVRQLESGDVPLEQALSLWEVGEALGARCQEVLDGAEARLSSGAVVINLDED